MNIHVPFKLQFCNKGKRWMKQQMDGRTLALVLGSSGTTKSVLLFSIVCFCAYSFFVGAYWTSAAFNFQSLPPPALLHTGVLSLWHTFLLWRPCGQSRLNIIKAIGRKQNNLAIREAVVPSHPFECHCAFVIMWLKLLFLTLSHTIKLHMACASNYNRLLRLHTVHARNITVARQL